MTADGAPGWRAVLLSGTRAAGLAGVMKAPEIG
jgi:hypothetical protein